MADWRPFNASNDTDTCLWCGRKLRHRTTESHYEMTEVPLAEDHPAWTHRGSTRKKYKLVVDRRAEKGGDYQDGQFCGLRCGMQFAWKLADLGRRLEAADPTQK